MRIPKIKIMPFETDSWTSRQGNILPWDKPEHLIRDAAICLVFGYAAALLFNFFYECIDGTRPYAEGGTVAGFSLKDFVSGFIGASVVVILTHNFGGLL